MVFGVSVDQCDGMAYTRKLKAGTLEVGLRISLPKKKIQLNISIQAKGPRGMVGGACTKFSINQSINQSNSVRWLG